MSNKNPYNPDASAQFPAQCPVQVPAHWLPEHGAPCRCGDCVACEFRKARLSWVDRRELENSERYPR